MNREKRLGMEHVVERLAKAMKASLVRKQSVEYFYWARKTKPAQPVNFPPVSPPYRRFSSAEIVAATGNFDESQLLGQGGFGRFYRGVIDDGATMVTVEHWWHRYNQDFFRAYVQDTYW